MAPAVGPSGGQGAQPVLSAGWEGTRRSGGASTAKAPGTEGGLREGPEVAARPGIGEGGGASDWTMRGVWAGAEKRRRTSFIGRSGTEETTAEQGVWFSLVYEYAASLG